MTLNLVQNISSSVTNTVTEIAKKASNSLRTTAVTDEEAEAKNNEDDFDIDAELLQKNRNDQRNKLVKYLNNIYSYLKTKRFLSDSGFNVKVDIVLGMILLYMYLIQSIFKKDGNMDLDQRILLYLIKLTKIILGNSFLINQAQGGVFVNRYY